MQERVREGAAYSHPRPPQWPVDWLDEPRYRSVDGEAGKVRATPGEGLARLEVRPPRTSPVQGIVDARLGIRDAVTVVVDHEAVRHPLVGWVPQRSTGLAGEGEVHADRRAVAGCVEPERGDVHGVDGQGHPITGFVRPCKLIHDRRVPARLDAHHFRPHGSKDPGRGCRRGGNRTERMNSAAMAFHEGLSSSPKTVARCARRRR